MLPIVINILLVIHVLVSLLIILIVLMQRPKNEGLGAAFGGGMTENLFGAQTTNVLQTITRWLGGMFFGLTLVLSILYVRQGGSRSAIQEKLTNMSVPAVATPAPPTAPQTESKTSSNEGDQPIEAAPEPGKAPPASDAGKPQESAEKKSDSSNPPPPATNQSPLPKDDDSAAPNPKPEAKKDAPSEEKKSGGAPKSPEPPK